MCSSVCLMMLLNSPACFIQGGETKVLPSASISES